MVPGYGQHVPKVPKGPPFENPGHAAYSAAMQLAQDSESSALQSQLYPSRFSKA